MFWGILLKVHSFVRVYFEIAIVAHSFEDMTSANMYIISLDHLFSFDSDIYRISNLTDHVLMR